MVMIYDCVDDDSNDGDDDDDDDSDGDSVISDVSDRIMNVGANVNIGDGSIDITNVIEFCA